MARAWRIEYEGALYHVLSRGNEGCNIVVDDKDRNLFLDRAYAYDDQVKTWLNTEMLLSQFLNVANRNLTYREAAQKYSKAEQRIWEDLRHGIFLGTKKFVQKIKKRHLPEIEDREIPQQTQLRKNIASEAILIQAADRSADQSSDC